MVVGYNHNFRYKNETFHVQTEDGGLKSPNIITLLYRGGTILASKKTSYADILKTSNLEQVVEELMKDQHKEMLRRLKDGDFDAVIEDRRPVAEARSVDEQTVAPVAPVGVVPRAPAPVPVAAEKPIIPPVKPVAQSSVEPVAEPDLDAIILAYLVGDDRQAT